MKYCWVKLIRKYMFGVYVGMTVDKKIANALIF